MGDNMKRITLFFIILSWIVQPVFAKEVELPQIYSVAEFKTKNLPPAVYHIEAYVTFIYTCPPCPAGALCKPCSPNFAIISDESQPHTATNDLTNKDLLLYRSSTEKLKIGHRYRFYIRVLEKDIYGGPGNAIKILNVKPL